jgi:hypothetical protein
MQNLASLLEEQKKKNYGVLAQVADIQSSFKNAGVQPLGTLISAHWPQSPTPPLETEDPALPLPVPHAHQPHRQLT